MAIAATVRAAEIQAKATILAAGIGALGIAAGIWFSWRTALSLQKKERITEIKKDVYLELTEAYSSLISELVLVSNGKWTAFIDALMLFSKKVDKAQFICEPENKETLLKFSRFLFETIKDFAPEIQEFIEFKEELDDLLKKHEKIMGRFEDASNALEKIKIENPNQQQIDNILEYFNEQVGYSKELLPQITVKENEVNEAKKILDSKVHLIVDKLNEQALPVSQFLREELGSKNNIQLDFEIYSKYKLT
jgi:hypothetical protein